MSKEALPNYMYNGILRGLNFLEDTAKQHCRHGLSIDDLREITTKPEHREFMTKASEFASASRFYSRSEFFHVIIGDDRHRIKTDVGHADFLYPKYLTKEGVEHHMHPDIREKLNTAVLELYDIATKKEHISKIVNYLNYNCNTPAQVKFYMPSCVTLLRRGISGRQSVADDVLKLKSPKAYPAIALEIRNDAMALGSVVSGWSMLPEKSDLPPDAFMKIGRAHV